MAEHVFDQRVEYVQTVYLVSSGYGQIEAYQRHDVGLRYTQRGVQARDEIRYLIERYELGGERVESTERIQ